MRLSANTRYAIRVLFELNGMPGPVATAFLAEKTGMTLRTVENIHTILRRAGITAGTVGAKGGIALVAPLETISLGRLVALFDDGVEFAVCCGDKSNDCPNQSGCGIREIWKGVSHDVQSRLDAISLATILQRYPTGPHGVILDAVYPDDAAFPGDMLRAPVCREYGRMTARPMRRKDRALPAAAAWELLEKGEYGFLVTVGADGLPYGVPLSYVLLEGGVYFHSARDGRKIDNILFCRDVSLTVVGDTEPVYVKNFTTYYASVMVSGTAKAVTDADEKFRALYALAGKYLPDHLDKAERDIRASFARTAVYRLDIETMTGKAKQPRPPG